MGGHKPMKDLNADCNGNGWHLYYGENNIENRQYYTTSIQRTVSDAHTGHDKNGLKRKLLEHDAIFKNQVYDLHRLYRTQRDMMEDRKTKEGHIHGDSIAPSCSSLQGSQAENGFSYQMGSCVRSSVLGTEIMTTPLSRAKGNGSGSSQVQLQNDCSKDYKVSEARPSKARKKSIDLQLPADEYSDAEDAEQLGTKTFDRSSFTLNQEYNGRLENSVKLSNGDLVRERPGSLQEGCSSVSNTRISIGLADLNEPAEIEEAKASSSIKIFGQLARKGIDLSAKHNSGLLDLPRDAMQKPGHGRNNSVNNFLTENNFDGSKWLPFSYEAEHAGGSRHLISRSIKEDRMSSRATPSKVLSQDHPPGFHFANHSQESTGKERMTWGLEGFHRSQDYANHIRREPTADSQPSNSYLFLGSSGVAHTRPHIMSPWVKPADSLSPKPTPFHSQSSSRGINKTLQGSALSNDVLRENWHVNNRPHSNTGLTRDPPSCNGLYHASSSGSKDSPVFGFDHLNCSRGGNKASSLLINHGIEKAYMDPSCIDKRPLKDFNLNETFLGNALIEAVPRQDLEQIKGKSKYEDHKPLLPWLRAKPPYNSGPANSRKDVISISSSPPPAPQCSLFCKRQTGKDLNGMYSATSSTNHGIWPKNERYETQSEKKILGVPIFQRLNAPENEASSLTSSASGRENAKQEKKNLIDINVACDDDSLFESGDESDVEEVVIEKFIESSRVKNFIDLNSCVTEDEDSLIPNGASSTSQKKFVADFDLEAPAVPEEEDNLLVKEKEQKGLSQLLHSDSDQIDNEVLMSAAKAIVDISSCQEKTVISLSSDVELESLLLFADFVTSTADKLEKECSHNMDDFEARALLLPETKEEDYMPKIFVPELQVEEAKGNAPPGRPRRGQARRGRQRRDFQRDILPGLATLSRYEMTEDLQTFGGLMRVTGHVWNCGSTRRNGGTRGRRRKAVELAHDSAPVGDCSQQMKNEENGLEDKKSLTGWGKTTRRPRRQRCHARNAPTVALT